jgi:hypothetical protein
MVCAPLSLDSNVANELLDVDKATWFSNSQRLLVEMEKQIKRKISILLTEPC